APSAEQLPENYIAILDGSTVVLRNAGGEQTWKYPVGGGNPPPALELRVSSGGGVTLDPSRFSTPQQVQCFGEEGVDCLGLTLRGIGPERPVTINPATGAVEADLGIIVDVTSLHGFDGVGTDCAFGPISGHLTSIDYSSATGNATLQASGMPLGTTSSCGDYNDLFNGALGLPGTVDVRFVSQIKIG